MTDAGKSGFYYNPNKIRKSKGRSNLMSESRAANVKRNIIWGNIGSGCSLILQVISRTAFIAFLGMDYLGINGLFSNVLGLLAFSELGIGMAMNYSLYKPIAENDTEKIKSLMKMYKIAYRWIAIIISVIGILIIPLLPYLVNGEYDCNDIYVYYLIFLFNTVSSYFVTYKYAYVMALQKQYIITNADTVLNFCVQIFQTIIIILFRNFLLYLIVQAVFGILQKVIMVLYINRRFPILVEKNIQPLDKETKDSIKTNVKALIIHKIGDASVHQTDNIVISFFISTVAVGIMSNYIMVQRAVAKFTDAIFNSFTASFGNLITSENREKQEKILDQYTFLGFWIFGFVTVAFISLSQPLFVLWGQITHKNMLVDNLTMFLYFITVYLGGQSLTLYNFKVAAGIFDDDKWVAMVQAVVNLIVSVIAVLWIGLPGVYVGTIVQRMVAIIWKPQIVYHKQFKKKAYSYFYKFFKYGATVSIACVLNILLLGLLFNNITVLSFAGMVCVTAVIPNVIFLLFRGRDIEFKELCKRVINKRY